MSLHEGYGVWHACEGQQDVLLDMFDIEPDEDQVSRVWEFWKERSSKSAYARFQEGQVYVKELDPSKVHRVGWPAVEPKPLDLPKDWVLTKDKEKVKEVVSLLMKAAEDALDRYDYPLAIHRTNLAMYLARDFGLSAESARCWERCKEIKEQEKCHL